MIRALTIITGVVALAVSAAPVASATSGSDRPMESVSYMKAGPPKPRTDMVVVANHTEGSVSVWTNGDGNDLAASTYFKPKPLSLNTFGGDDTRLGVRVDHSRHMQGRGRAH